MDAIKAEREKHKSRLVENPGALPRVPMDPKLRQGTKLVRQRAENQKGLSAQKTNASKKTTSLIEICRRQVQREKSAHMSTPTCLLSLKSSKITSVPQSFLDKRRSEQKPMKEVGLKRKLDDISDDSTENEPVSPKSKIQQEREEKAKRREIALARGRVIKAQETAGKLAARMW
jgi:hypothetical protein